jgi:general secretion pathway protein K
VTPRRFPRRQRGVAVVTALLLTTLAISIVASLFWQQQVQVRSMENQRLQLQTKWILRGALDWAGLVLRQDKYDNPRYTSLDKVWAMPVAETRLDQYIERERLQGENFEATLSGNMVDAASRYNLNNLASGGQVDPEQLAVFSRLLQNVQMNPGLAKQAANFVAASQASTQVPGQTPASNPPPGPPNPPAPNPPTGQGVVAKKSTTMKLVRLEDLLAVPGFTQAMVDKLRPFAIVLPSAQPTKVNVNTAPAEVLAALVPSYSVAQANSLVEQRKRAPWDDIAKFGAQVNAPNVANVADVRSDWFLVQSHIRLDRAALNSEALVDRGSSGVQLITTPVVKWIRQN